MYTLNFPSKKSAISSCAAPNCTCQEKQFSHTSDTPPRQPERRSGTLHHACRPLIAPPSGLKGRRPADAAQPHPRPDPQPTALRVTPSRSLVVITPGGPCKGQPPAEPWLTTQHPGPSLCAHPAPSPLSRHRTPGPHILDVSTISLSKCSSTAPRCSDRTTSCTKAPGLYAG